MIDNLRHIIADFYRRSLISATSFSILRKESIAKRPYLNLLGLFSLLICLTFTSCAGEPSTAKKATTSTPEVVKADAPKKSDNKVVLFFGDSLTAGFGLDADQSFPSLIENKIDSLGLKYSVVNAGLSGETTSGGLKRIDWVMKQKVDIFFLELGANDMLRGLPIDQTRKNLSEIISIVKAKNPNVKIALCEMMAAPNMGAEYVKEFTNIYKDLSTPADITLVPFFLDGVIGHEALMLKDGKHPNAAGQVIVADNIWRSLEGML